MQESPIETRERDYIFFFASGIHKTKIISPGATAVRKLICCGGSHSWTNSGLSRIRKLASSEVPRCLEQSACVEDAAKRLNASQDSLQ